MFPVGPRRPFQRVPIQRREPRSKRKSNDSDLFALFKDTDGKFDLEKVTTTVEQINRLYGNVSPLFSRFFNK